MGLTPFIIFLIVLFVTAFYLFKKRRLLTQKQHIETFSFPEKINQELIKTYPHLTINQQKEVIKGLRDYFHVCLTLGRKPVAMPSKVVDSAWHEFILFTKAYKNFCNQALGRFLHHTPAEAMSSQTKAQQGIKNCWQVACKIKNIDPKNPKKLPLLFAIDKKLKIKGGFEYTLNCKKTHGAPNYGDRYCASHIGCGSSCGTSCESSCSSGCSGCGD